MTERKIKIAYLIPTLTLGGAEKQQISIFNSIDRNIFEPKLFVFKKRTDLLSQIDKKDEVVVYDSRGVCSLAISGIIKDLRAFSPDIIHSHMYNANLFSRFVSIFLPEAKIVNHIHGLSRWMGPFKLFLEKVTSSKVDSFIVVGEKSRALRLTREKYPERKMTVLYNSADIDKFKDVPPLRESTVNLGTASRLIGLKRIDRVVSFVEWCRDKGFSVVLHIAGEGPEEDNLRKLVSDLKLKDMIIFHGMVHDMGSFYSKIDVLCISSETEDLPLTIPEALASGKAVISTPVGGIPEALEKSVSMITEFDQSSYDRIWKFLSDLDRDAASSVNRLAAGKFSHESYMKRLQKLYAGLAGVK